jgi:hypothetical protein
MAAIQRHSRRAVGQRSRFGQAWRVSSASFAPFRLTQFSGHTSCHGREFRDRWIPDFTKDGAKIGVNWSGSRATGFDIDGVNPKFVWFGIR